MRIQKRPNVVCFGRDRRLVLTRLRWENRIRRITVSNKLSISICWEPRDLWVGVYWTTLLHELEVFICILPCLPLRLRWVRSWGGIFP